MPPSGLFWKNWARRLASTPGTGTWAMKRKMISATAVKISLRRRSGRFQALMRALSIRLAAFASPLLARPRLHARVDAHALVGALARRHVAGADRPSLGLHLLDAELGHAATGGLDLLARALGDLVRGHGERDGQLAVAEDLERQVLAAQPQPLERGQVDLRASLEALAEQADVEDLVLDAPGVLEAALVGQPLDHADLAALEPGDHAVALAGLLTLGPLGRGHAVAGPDAAPDPLLRPARSRGRPKIVQLHSLLLGRVDANQVSNRLDH